MKSDDGSGYVEFTGEWSKDALTYLVEASDPETDLVASGINAVKYSTDGGTTWKAMDTKKYSKGEDGTYIEDDENGTTYYVYELPENFAGEIKFQALDYAVNDSEVVTCKSYVDTKEPAVSEITMGKSNVDKFLSFLTFGIYANDEIEVTVTTNDEKQEVTIGKNTDGTEKKVKVASGIRSIELGYLDDKNEFQTVDTADKDNFDPYTDGEDDITATASFTITETPSVETVYVVKVTDEAGNVMYYSPKSGISDTDKSEHTFGSGELLGYESVDDLVNGTAKVLIEDVAPVVTSIEHDTGSNVVYPNGEEITEETDGIWTNGGFTWNITVVDDNDDNRETEIDTNKVSGINNVTAKDSLSGNLLVKNEEKDGESKDYSSSKKTTVTETESDLSVSGEGEHTITVNAQDNAGNEATAATKTVYIDETAPVVEQIKMTKSTSASLLSFLTFGIYSNNNIAVKVSVEDYYDSNGNAKGGVTGGSGVKSIELGYLDSNGSFKTDSAKITNGSYGSSNKTRSFTVSGTLSEETTLVVKVTDNVGNVKYYSPNNWSTISSNSSSSKTFGASDISGSENASDLKSGSAKTLIETTAPSVTIDTPTLENEYKESNSKTWTSGGFTYTFKATDSDSGINNLKADDSIENSGSWTYASNNVETENGKITDTKNESVNDEKLAVTTEGKHTITVVAQDNAGNTGSSKKTVYVDETAPDKLDIYMTTEDGDYNCGENGENNKVIWSNKSVTVTAYAKDANNDDDTKSSGVASIRFVATDDAEGVVKDETFTDKEKDNNGRNQYDESITLDPEFSGKVTITVTDRVGYTKTQTVYVNTENDPPGVSEFKLEPLTESNGNSYSTTYEQKSYGYYFTADTSVTVSFSDGTKSSGITGAEYVLVPKSVIESGNIEGYLNDSSKTSLGVSSSIKWSKDGENSTCTGSFVVPASFKGQIYVRAYDKAGNTGAWTTPNGVILETQSQHNSNSSITISRAATSASDINGTPLYSSAQEVTLTVTDNYSGIEKIEYQVYSTARDTEISSGTVEVGNSGSFTGTGSSWSVLSSDNNLITSLQGKLTIGTNENNIRIYVKLTDRAGNTSEKSDYLSIDTTDPTVKITYNNPTEDSDGIRYYNKQCIATITVNDRNFNQSKYNMVVTKAVGAAAAKTYTNSSSEYKMSGWSHSTLVGYDVTDSDGKNTWTMTITFTEDADYTLQAEVFDLAGNTAKTTIDNDDKFTVDTTAPALDVEILYSEDVNPNRKNGYYKEDLEVKFTVTEHNFNAEDVKMTYDAYDADNVTESEEEYELPTDVSKWEHTEGTDVYTYTIDLDDDGKFNFSLNYTDYAKNKAAEDSTGTFYIDTALPVIKESDDVEDEKAFNGDLTAVFTYTDYNLGSTQEDAEENCTITVEKVDIEANGEDVTSSQNNYEESNADSKNELTRSITSLFNGKNDSGNFDESIDGIYEITVAAEDLAGNKAETKTFTISVNRYGSTYRIINDPAKELIANYDEGVYANEEVDFEIEEINASEIEETTIKVTKDLNDATTLKEGTGYEVTNSTGSMGTDEVEKSWFSNTYKVAASNFEKDGRYQLTISSVDKAENENSNDTPVDKSRELPIEFVIDKTLPEVVFAGIEEGEESKETSVNLKVTCIDENFDKEEAKQFTADKLQVTVNGETINISDITDLDYEGQDITFTLPIEAEKSNTENEIKVVIKDKANNASDEDGSTIKFTLNASFFRRHKTLVMGLGFGLLALILLIITIKIAKKKDLR